MKGQQPIILTILLLIGAASTFAQPKGHVLVVTDIQAVVVVDGEELGTAEPNNPQKFELTAGQHYLQVIPTDGTEEKNEILTIEAGVQKVLKYEFGIATESMAITQAIVVAEMDFTIPGLSTVGMLEEAEYPTFLHAFEKGDRVIINFEMANKKGTNIIEVYTYPAETPVYYNDSFQDLENVGFDVPERSMYVFVFSTNHTFDRDVKLQIERIPESEATAGFNTNVSWQESYVVHEVVKPQKFFVNSISNEAFRGGKSQVTLPVVLPQNTLKWYYTFSASRNEETITSTTGGLDLATELANLIDQTGIAGLALSMFTQPPGSDFCDIYLLDHENFSLFNARDPFRYVPEGSRENLESGIVEVTCCTDIPIYLGIRNPSEFHGIHVVVEVAAITKEEDWVMHVEK